MEPPSPSQPPPDSSGIHMGDVGGNVNFSALGDIVGGDKITTITTTIQISVEAVTQRPLITTSPYRGLDRFEDRDKDLFFGRDQLIKSLLAQLSASNVLLVLGASGSGKSSVVRAGLLPHLSQLIGARFRYFTLVPDVNPFESLRTALQGAGFSQAQTRELADAKPETPAKLMHALQRSGDQWLFFIDQFEEIFTVGDEKLRASFIAALVQIAQDTTSSAKLVLAMRADFLDRFSPFPEFAKIIEKNIDFVADMHADELRQAIEQPAARHGVVFEQGLVEEIIKDVQGQAGSLPLLQYTLDLLWHEEARENGLADRHLNTATYRELGGVRGALQKRANEIYASFGDDSEAKAATPKQEIVRQIFLRLVDLAGEGSDAAAWRPVRRRASMAMFASTQEQEILQELINQKLLVSNREGDDATVEVAHEALFTSWGRLRNWIEAGKQVIFARNRLADDARRWQHRQQEDDRGADEELLSGSRLAQAIDMRGRGDFLTVVGGLGALETQFLDASVALRDRRAQEEQARQQRELEAAQRLAAVQKIAAGRLRKGLVVAVVLALFAIAGGWFALRQSQRAKDQEREAKEETARSEHLRALSLVEEGDADQALRSLARSLELDPSNSAVATRLIHLLGQRQWPRLAAIQNHNLPIRSLEKNADASRIIVATKSADIMQMESQIIYLRDAESLRAAGTAELDSYDILDLKVSGDRVLVTGWRSTMAMLLDTKTGKELKKWPATEQAGPEFYYCTFSTDGKWAVLWGDPALPSPVEIVSAADGKPHPSIPHIRYSKSIKTVMMNETEIRFLNGDGSVTIQPLKGPQAAPPRTFPVVKELNQESPAVFTFGGEVLVEVRKNGIEFWPVSQSKVNDPAGWTRVVPSKGLEMFAVNSPLNVSISSNTDSVTIVAQESKFSPGSVASSVTQIKRLNEVGPSAVADWHSPFAPIQLLSPGIAVARDTKAFVLPFHGGAFSGPFRHASQITAICGVREGLVVTGAADGQVKLWNLPPAAFPAAPRSTSTATSGAGESVLLARSRSGEVEVWSKSEGMVIKRGGKEVNVQMPRYLSGFGSVELSADGERGIFTGSGECDALVGAWIFNAKDGTLLSDSVGKCEWAGFDQEQIMTIDHGTLRFWNLRQDEKTFNAASRTVLFQSDMQVAVAEAHNPVMTRSVAGEVIVWDRTAGTPLHRLRRDPLWNDVELNGEQASGGSLICKPALSLSARRVATAYGRAFVIWDLDGGKPLSDPIYCADEIHHLEFPADHPTTVQATLRDGSKVAWDHAAFRDTLAPRDAAVLQSLARAVADNQWPINVLSLAGYAPSSPAVAKLLEHFAAQARALSENAPKTAVAPAAPK